MSAQKPGVFTFVHSVKKLCRFVTKYQGGMLTALFLVITDPTERAAITALINAIVTACAVLEKYFPNISA